MHKLLSIFILISSSAFANPGDFIALTPLTRDLGQNAKQTRAFFCPAAAGQGTPVDVQRYNITYETVDLAGHPTTTHGLLLLPITPAGTKLPLVIYQHGTLYARSELPSSNLSIGEGDASSACFASMGYLTVIADYLGFGDGTGVHPYLHAASEAWTARDLLRATRQAAPSNLHLALTNELFVAGYSQGGHAAMALHRALQEDPNHEFTVTAAADGAGPYAISAMVPAALAQALAGGSAEAAYLVLGLNPAYQFFAQTSDVINTSYVNLVSSLFDGTHTSADVNATLPMGPTVLFQAAFLKDVATNPNSKFLAALKDNDDYNWKPLAPVRLYHGQGDKTVPYANSVQAASVMKALGATDVQLVSLGSTVDHLPGFPLMMGQAANWFQSLRTKSGSM